MTRALLALLIALACPCATRANDAPPARREFDSGRWAAWVAQIQAADAKHPPPQDAVLFVGSSTVVGWDTREAFADRAVINRGFGGSTIPDVLAWMDAIVLPYRPKVVVFYSGDNDVAWGQPPHHVIEDFRRFARRTLTALPDTHLIALSIKPSVTRWAHWPDMAQANRGIAAACAEHNRMTYLDLTETVLNEHGEPSPKAFTDGLHMTAATYRVWTQRVKDELAEIEDEASAPGASR